MIGWPSLHASTAPLTFTAGADTICVMASSRSERSLISRAMQRRPSGDLRSELTAVFDSLGFFSVQWDTLRPHCMQALAGPRAIVDSIVVRAEKSGTPDSLPSWRLPFPFDAGQIDALASQALRAFAQRGFPFAKLSVAIEPAAGGPQRVRAVFAVDCGERCAFDDPLLNGFSRTRRGVFLHDCRMRPGALFDIRKIEETRARLLARPYVAAAAVFGPRIATKQDADLSGAAAAMPRVAVPLVITERSGLAVDGVVGFRSDPADRVRVSGDLNVRLLNSLGFGEEAGLAYWADARQQRLEASSVIPWIFDTPLHMQLTGGLEVKEKEYGFMRGSTRLFIELRPRLQTGIGVRGFRNETAGASALRTCSGAELAIRRPGEVLRRGAWAHELDITVGSSLISAAGMRRTRWNADFIAGTHIPFNQQWGVHLRLVSHTLISAEDSIPAVELYRTGGYRSVRGYADKTYPFRSVLYGQSELLLYFARAGAVYILCDGGAGFYDRLTASGRTDLLGYGIGVRVGTRLGAFSLEWARNIEDTRSLGRVHLRFQNPLSMEARR